jgi:phenylalanyl-tRNA synthetase alpha chain
MKEQLEKIRNDALKEIEKAQELSQLENIRVRYTGKKSDMTAILKQMGRLSKEERPAMGQLANTVRSDIDTALREKVLQLNKERQEKRISEEKIDITMPGKEFPMGKRHPLNLVLDEFTEIFLGMGFDVVEGPEVEYDEYNFTKLNMPKSHPARDTQATFYITDSILLRTQTTPIEARALEKLKPPFRIIAPGRVYRSDEIDATHSPIFHQIEGLIVQEGITFADLKGTLEAFVKKMFGPETKTRFRPHHFAYTEPSAEMDMTCFKCGGKGCPVCKGEGWIEILGCGVTNPIFLETCGVDSKKYQAFAFGFGLERLALMKYNIDDLRLLYENFITVLKE